MVKNHIKTIAVPRSWPVHRKKATKYILRPAPGAHALDRGMPLALMLNMLKLANTKREVTLLLHTSEVLVDGVRRKTNDFIVGLFDVLSVPSLGKSWRVVISSGGELGLIPVEGAETSLKPLKITGKSLHKGKIQLSCSDGRTVLTDDATYKVGDSILYDLSKKAVKKRLPLTKGSIIFLVGGKSLGKLGAVEEVLGRTIVYKVGDEVNQTKRRYAFVIGEGKALISVEA